MSHSEFPQVEYLCTAAMREAIERGHPSVGSDHLLFVICQTEEGRRFVEDAGGKYQDVINSLENSFVDRAKSGTVQTRIPFTLELREILGTSIRSAESSGNRDGGIRQILEAMIMEAGISPITRMALNSGGFTDVRKFTVKNQEREIEDLLFDEAQDRAVGAPETAGNTEADDIRDADRITKLLALRQARRAMEAGTLAPGGGAGRAPGIGAGGSDMREAAEKSIRNLSELARSGDLDPVIGRRDVLGSMVTTLSRRRKRNILLLGDPGVGKTTLLEGLAQLLNEASQMTPEEVAEGVEPGSLTSLAAELNIPEDLFGRPVLEVSLARLIAGAKYRGEFEGRLQALMEIASEQGAIVFIDEIHGLMGAGSGGSQGGGLDASNIMKPALARGEMILVGASTYGSESRTLRSDGALMRRFTEMPVNEPSEAETAEILSSSIGSYAAHHGLVYGDDILGYCAEMAGVFLPDRFFPDKAFDVADLAGTIARSEQQDAVRRADVRQAAYSLAGIRPYDDPVRAARLAGLEEALSSSIFGQKKAVSELATAARIASQGLSDQGVAGSYLFNGESGVGKSALGEAFARALGIPFMRIDLSEFMERHAVSRLIGAPPGYVGHDRSEGLLVKAAETHKEMVLLLDEADKAHPDVFDILLQVLEYGVVRSGEGRVLSVRGWHIVLTSNLGADPDAGEPLGFGRSRNEDEIQDTAVRGFFRRELLSRIGSVVTFARVDGEPLEKIAGLEIERLVVRLARQDRSLEIGDGVVDGIIERARAGSKRPSGRDIREVVRREIVDGIARASLGRSASQFEASWNADGLKVVSLD